MFAHGVSIGNTRYNTEDESAVLVTVAEDIRIVISASPTEPAKYIDVPLEHVGKVSLKSTRNSQSQSFSYVVLIEMSPAVVNAYYLNAIGNGDRLILIAFVSESHAKTVLKLLQQTTARTKQDVKSLKAQEPIECSSNISDDELAAPASASMSKQDLTQVAQRAAAILPENLPTNVARPVVNRVDLVSRVIIAQRYGSGTSLRPDAAEDRKHASVTVSGVIEGIDCSLPHPTSNILAAQDLSLNASDSIHAQATQRHDASGDVEQSLDAHFEPTSDSELPRSLPWQTGLNEIDNAPEFQDSKDNEMGQAPQDQAEDYDSSYDVSPRPSRNANKKANSTIQPHSKIYQPSKTQEAVDLPATGDALSEEQPTFKSREILRNGERYTHVAIARPHKGQPANFPGDDLITNTKSKMTNISKAQLSARSNGKIQKSQPLKKAKANKTKPNEIAETVLNGKDDLGLPTSSKGPNIKSGIPKMSTVTALNQGISQANGRKGGQKLLSGDPSGTSSLASQHPMIDARTTPISKNRSEALIGPSKASKIGRLEDESIWDLGPEASDEGQNQDSKRGSNVKSIKKQPAKIARDRKPERPQSKAKKSETREPVRASAKAKPPPETLKKLRPRRDAAKKANERILGVAEADEIEDEDAEIVTKPQKKLQPVIVKQTARATEAQQSHIKAKDRAPTIDQGSHADEETITKLTKPDQSTKAQSKVGPSSDIESLEKLDPMTNASRQIGKQADTNPEPSASRHEADSSLGSKGMSLVAADTVTDKNKPPRNERMAHARGAQDPEQPLAPDSVAEKDDVVQKAEPDAIVEPLIEDTDDLEPVHMVGDAEDSHFQEGLLNSDTVDDEDAQTSHEKHQPTHEISEPEAMSTPQTNVKGKTTAKSNEVERQASVKNMQPTSVSIQPKINNRTSTARDPFGAKLDLLAQGTRITSAETHKTAGARNGRISKASKKPKMGVSEGTTDTAAQDTRPAEKARQPAHSSREHEAKDTVASEKTSNQAQPRKAEQPALKTQKGGSKVRNRATSDRQEDTMNQETPKLLGHVIGTIRKSRDDGGPEHKTPSLLTIEERIKPVQNIIDTDDKVIPECSRKPGLISFSASGPRNQGIVSIKKTKPLKVSKATQGVNEKLDEESSAPKRKSALYVDDPASWEHDHLVKRQKLDVIPTNEHKHVPQMIPEPLATIEQENSYRLGSQSTRVNENGSPMHVVHSRHDNSASQGQYPDNDDVKGAFANAQLEDDDDKMVIQDVNDWEDPTLHPTNHTVLPQEDGGITNLSSNTKQQPSSPNAPSTFATLPAHHVYHDGKIVNPETTENIIPTVLQDPFVGGGRNQTSLFIETLRRLSYREVQRLGTRTNEQTAPGLTRRSLLHDEDPDKTLVEPERARKRRKVDLISDTSSSSDSTSSEDASPSQGVTHYESDGETLAEWRKAFEPHQNNMLDVLSNITYVSR